MNIALAIVGIINELSGQVLRFTALLRDYHEGKYDQEWFEAEIAKLGQQHDADVADLLKRLRTGE